jgi:hypothetical protein
MQYNPLPYFQYAASNYVTGELQVPLQLDMHQMVQRLQLSPLQKLHLRIVIKEYDRLCKAASQTADVLAAQLEHLSLAAVASNKNAGLWSAAAAAAGGPAVAAAAAVVRDELPGSTQGELLQRQLDHFLRRISLNINLAVSCIGEACEMVAARARYGTNAAPPAVPLQPCAVLAQFGGQAVEYGACMA